MLANVDELKQLSEWPAVATACGMVREGLRGMLSGYDLTEIEDGGIVALPHGTTATAIRLLFVTHVDEVGGFVMFPEEEGFGARLIGNRAGAFAYTPLQAFRCGATDSADAIPCQGRALDDGRLILQGEGLEPLTMLWTFREAFRVEGDTISGKALDPRVTVYCTVEAARQLQRPDAGLLFCYAEECGRGAAAKLAVYIQRHMPSLEVVVNADVPGQQNLSGATLQDAAIRPFEGGELIDPCFSISLYDRLVAAGVAVKLAVAASRSQTGVFAPLARAVSVALPASVVHQARSEMSLTGVERCIRLLAAIGEIV